LKIAGRNCWGCIVPVSEQTYLQLVLEDPQGHWELECGKLRSEPPMTFDRSTVMARLTFQIMQQVSEADFWVRPNHGRLRRPDVGYFEPDVCVVPNAMVRRLFPHRGMVEFYPDALPFVAEVWSPSMGAYDVTTKLIHYRTEDGVMPRSGWCIPMTGRSLFGRGSRTGHTDQRAARRRRDAGCRAGGCY